MYFNFLKKITTISKATYIILVFGLLSVFSVAESEPKMFDINVGEIESQIEKSIIHKNQEKLDYTLGALRSQNIDFDVFQYRYSAFVVTPNRSGKNTVLNVSAITLAVLNRNVPALRSILKFQKDKVSDKSYWTKEDHLMTEELKRSYSLDDFEVFFALYEDYPSINKTQYAETVIDILIHNRNTSWIEKILDRDSNFASILHDYADTYFADFIRYDYLSGGTKLEEAKQLYALYQKSVSILYKHHPSPELKKPSAKMIYAILLRAIKMHRKEIFLYFLTHEDFQLRTDYAYDLGRKNFTTGIEIYEELLRRSTTYANEIEVIASLARHVPEINLNKSRHKIRHTPLAYVFDQAINDDVYKLLKTLLFLQPNINLKKDNINGGKSRTYFEEFGRHTSKRLIFFAHEPHQKEKRIRNEGFRPIESRTYIEDITKDEFYPDEIVVEADCLKEEKKWYNRAKKAAVFIKLKDGARRVPVHYVDSNHYLGSSMPSTKYPISTKLSEDLHYAYVKQSFEKDTDCGNFYRETQIELRRARELETTLSFEEDKEGVYRLKADI